MLRHVALVRTDVSEEPGASFIRVTRIGELGTTQAATSNRRTLWRNSISPILVTLMKEAPGSSETSVLTRATRRNNPEDTILLSVAVCCRVHGLVMCSCGIHGVCFIYNMYHYGVISSDIVLIYLLRCIFLSLRMYFASWCP
jgi:uncharacterized membrane protein